MNRTKTWAIRGGKNDEAFSFFDKQELVALAYPEVSDLSNSASLSDVKTLTTDCLPQNNRMVIGRIANQLYKFKSAETGDLMVFVSKSPKLLIGELTGPYNYQPEALEGFVHTRPVKWTSRLLKGDLPPDASRELLSACSFFRIKTSFFLRIAGRIE